MSVKVTEVTTEQKEWLQTHLACSIQTEDITKFIRQKLVTWFTVSMALGVLLIWIELVVILFATGHWIWAVVTLIPPPVVIIGLYYLIKAILNEKIVYEKWGGPIIKFEDVPRMKTLILRWRFSGKRSKDKGYDPTRDEALYSEFTSGLVIYSPWLFARVAVVDMEPLLLPQEPIEVNAIDGTLIDVDTQPTVSFPYPIGFVLNVGNDRDKCARIVKEYLHTGLQGITSISNEDAKNKPLPDSQKEIMVYESHEKAGVVEYNSVPYEEEGKKFTDLWNSGVVELSRASKKTQISMGLILTNWMNHWLSSGRPGTKGGEQNFGIHVEVKIVSFQPPPTIAAGQEAEAAADLRASEVEKQAAGYANVVRAITGSVEESLPDDLKPELQKIIASPDEDPVVKAAALALLNKATVDATKVTIAMGILPTVADMVERLVSGAGKRAKRASKKPGDDKSEKSDDDDKKKEKS